MNTTKTAPLADEQVATAVTVTGTVRSPLTLMRRISDHVARVSFRIDGADGPYNACFGRTRGAAPDRRAQGRHRHHHR